MRTGTRVAVALAAMCMIAGQVSAGQGSDAQAEARARTISPYTDEMTVAVFRVDLARVDVEAIRSRLDAWFQMREGSPDALPNELVPAWEHLGQAKRLIGQIVSAGAKDLYVTVSLLDPSVGTAVIPLPAGARAETIEPVAVQLVTGRTAAATQATATQHAAQQLYSPYAPCVRRMGDALVIGAQRVIDRMQLGEAAARPDLVQAFAAAGDAPVTAAVVLSPEARRVATALAPMSDMPVAPEALLMGVRWAALGVDLPPAMAARLMIQSQDAAAAQTLHDALAGALKDLQTRAAATQPAALRGIERIVAELGAPLTNMLLPQVKGDRLVLTISGEQFDRLMLEGLLSPLSRDREMARRAVSSANVSAILKAILIYQNTAQGQWPQSLDVLVEKNLITPAMLRSPRRPDLAVGYVYLPPKEPASKVDPEQLVIYEAFDNWGEGTIVGYADTHVMWLDNRARFERERAQATARGAVPQEGKRAAPGASRPAVSLDVAAKRARAAAHIGQLLRFVGLYAMEHDNQWPESLDALVRAYEGRGVRQMLANPLRPDMKEPYVYVRPAQPAGQLDPDAVLVYEAFDDWGEGIHVGFATGRVQFVSDRNEFERMLARTGDETR